MVSVAPVSVYSYCLTASAKNANKVARGTRVDPRAGESREDEKHQSRDGAAAADLSNQGVVVIRGNVSLIGFK